MRLNLKGFKIKRIVTSRCQLCCAAWSAVHALHPDRRPEQQQEHVARMREDREELRQQARLQKMALSDQAIQQTANAPPLAQRRPWWPRHS